MTWDIFGEVGEILNYIEKAKKKGRGHWGHRGRKGRRGGSLPKGITSGDISVARVVLGNLVDKGFRVNPKDIPEFERAMKVFRHYRPGRGTVLYRGEKDPSRLVGDRFSTDQLSSWTRRKDFAEAYGGQILTHTLTSSKPVLVDVAQFTKQYGISTNLVGEDEVLAAQEVILMPGSYSVG